MKKFFDSKNPLNGAIYLFIFTTVFILIDIFYIKSDLLNTIANFFSGLSTLLVGLYAFLLYNKQKSDQKRDAASIIIQEIEYAEKVIKRAQYELEKPDPLLSVTELSMPATSWGNYKYLFVNDLDSAQLDSITIFYNACDSFDSAVKLENSQFNRNRKYVREFCHKRASELTWDFYNFLNGKEITKEMKDSLEKRIREETAYYINVTSSKADYYFKKPSLQAKESLDSIKVNVSLPGALDRLKSISAPR